MGDSTFTIFSSTSGLIVAAMSLFLQLVNICRSQLPSNKIKELESSLEETQTYIKRTMEDGLLVDPEMSLQTARDLATLEKKTYHLQSIAYDITTFRQDFLELCKGTSKSIEGTYQALKKVKAKVAASSEKACAKVIESKSVVRLAYATLLPALHSPPEPECHPMLLHCGQNPRPCSCPPGMDEEQRGFIQGSSSGDFAQSDPDVRTVDMQTCIPPIHTTVTV